MAKRKSTGLVGKRGTVVPSGFTRTESTAFNWRMSGIEGGAAPARNPVLIALRLSAYCGAEGTSFVYGTLPEVAFGEADVWSGLRVSMLTAADPWASWPNC